MPQTRPKSNSDHINILRVGFAEPEIGTFCLVLQFSLLFYWNVQWQVNFSFPFLFVSIEKIGFSEMGFVFANWILFVALEFELKEKWKKRKEEEEGERALWF